jgi:hypothetical protein
MSEMSLVPFPPLVRSLLGALLLVLLAAPASADTTAAASAPADDALMPFRLDAHASLTWESSFGVGARADISIIDKARMFSSRDELALSVGADVVFITFGGSNKIYVWPTAVLQWSLGLSERGVFYPELGLTARIKPDGWGGVFPNIGFGGRYYLHRSLALLGRLGWPMAVSLGMTF